MLGKVFVEMAIPQYCTEMLLHFRLLFFMDGCLQVYDLNVVVGFLVTVCNFLVSIL